VLDQTIGRFTIRARLGAGSFGEVWRADHVDGGNIVAIKLFRPELAGTDAMHDAFAEARALARVVSSGFAKIYDADLYGGRPFIISELVDGDTLAAHIERNRFSGTQVVATIHPLCRALSTAHGANVMHHDLKPTNVMIGRDQRVVIVDFGASKLVAAAPQLATAAYLAPEQLDGAHADGTADVYALGCLAYEMATARRAFSDNQPRYPAPSVRALVPDCALVLDRLIATMLEVRPQERPSMREITKRFGMLASLQSPLDETLD
jgi:serine/threonine-protein kinase